MKPPRLASWLIEHFMDPVSAEAIGGDLAEQFARRATRGRLSAHSWFWMETFASLLALARGDPTIAARVLDAGGEPHGRSRSGPAFRAAHALARAGAHPCLDPHVGARDWRGHGHRHGREPRAGAAAAVSVPASASFTPVPSTPTACRSATSASRRRLTGAPASGRSTRSRSFEAGRRQSSAVTAPSASTA